MRLEGTSRHPKLNNFSSIPSISPSIHHPPWGGGAPSARPGFHLFSPGARGAPAAPPGAAGALAQRQFERGEQLVVPVFDAAAVFFHDGRKAHVRALVSGKALAAGGA